MRESPTDNAVAVALAVALHVLLLGLMLAGMWWSRESKPISAAGSPVTADVVDFNSLSNAQRRSLSDRPDPIVEPTPEPEPEPEPIPEPPVEEAVPPPPQPLPEPRPEDAPTPPQPKVQERVPDPAPIDQVAVRREAAAEQARVQREQEEKRRQEQIDLTERKRQEEAEQKRRQAQQQLEKIRADRAKAEREERLAQERLKQIADRRAPAAPQPGATSAAPPPPGNAGVDAGLAARYAAALQEAILRNWTRPDNIAPGQRCRISIRQTVGGQVVSAQVDPSCPYDEQGRRSVEAAVLKAEPLPYAGFESVFQRNLILNFQAQDR